MVARRPQVFEYTADDFFASLGVPLTLTRAHHQTPQPLHTHDFAEMVFVRDGNGVHIVGDTRERCGIVPGDVLLIAPGERHGYDCTNLVIDNLLFRHDLLTGPARSLALDALSLLEELFRLPPVRRGVRLPVEQRERVWRSVVLMDEELRRRRPGFRTAAFSWFLDCVVQVGRAAVVGSGLEPMDDAVAGTAGPASVASAIEYIRLRFSDSLTLSEIADVACLTPGHFCEVFKRETGKSPWEFLTALRVLHSKHLLTTYTGMSISQIAQACGYSDAAYYARVFRAAEGCSPTAYRSACRR